MPERTRLAFRQNWNVSFGCRGSHYCRGLRAGNMSAIDQFPLAAAAGGAIMREPEPARP